MVKVQAELDRMRSLKHDAKAKGDAGEAATLLVVNEYAKQTKSVVAESYYYHAAKKPDGNSYPGNLKVVNGQLIEEQGNIDEVDVILITERRVFLIEVKSYGDAKLVVTDDWFFRNSSPYEKDLFEQTEKHARLFYHTMYECIPDGDPRYIVPIFCTVDISTLTNKSQDNYPISSLNSLNKVIGKYDRQMKHCIDIEALVAEMRKHTTPEKPLRLR